MASVILEDESLRDGLQFEQKILALEEKLSLFRLLAAAGVKPVADRITRWRPGSTS